MDLAKDRVNDRRAYLVARAVGLGLTYFAGAELGHALSLKTDDQMFATWWPPAGFLLAALLQTPCRSWPALLLAAGGANVASDLLLHDKSVAVSLGFCLANFAEACLGAWLLRRFVGAPLTLARIKDVLALAILSSLISTMLGATVGAGIAAIAFGTPYASAWRVWWVADAVGVLVFAPLVLTWTAERATLFKNAGPWRIVEAVALGLGTIIVTEAIYGEFVPPPLMVPIYILPFLLWAGCRFGPSGAAAALLFVSLIGIGNTSQGRGPYAALSAVPSERLMKAQATLGVTILSVLVLAATVAERKQAEEQRLKLIAELEQALSEIKTLRGLIPLCAWCKKIRDVEGLWLRLEDYVRTHTEAEITHAMCPECMKQQMASAGRASPKR
jgi:integral membrane sensor domain MASE1